MKIIYFTIPFSRLHKLNKVKKVGWKKVKRRMFDLFKCWAGDHKRCPILKNFSCTGLYILVFWIKTSVKMVNFGHYLWLIINDSQISKKRFQDDGWRENHHSSNQMQLNYLVPCSKTGWRLSNSAEKYLKQNRQVA